MLFSTTTKIVSSILSIFFITAYAQVAQPTQIAGEEPRPQIIEAGHWVELQGEVTAYTSDPAETDDSPEITASGQHTRDGVIACPIRYAFGTRVRIDGKEYDCQDRMAARYQHTNRFDIWTETKAEAYQIGLKAKTIEIWEKSKNAPSSSTSTSASEVKQHQ